MKIKALFTEKIDRFIPHIPNGNKEEAIQNRLLAKKDMVKNGLRLLYYNQYDMIKDLIIFTKDTPEQRLYVDEEEFVASYPFIPYQFVLLQGIIAGIEKRMGTSQLFEEESVLLSAFQKSVVEFGAFDAGALIPFDAFYRPVEKFLPRDIQMLFHCVEGNDKLFPDDYAVLKILWLIQYVGEQFPSTGDNIVTLMIQNIHEIRATVEKRVNASLKRLTEQEMIIKYSERYFFLSKDDQEIYKDSKGVKVATSDLIDKLGKHIFQHLFGSHLSCRHREHDFSFNLLIDERTVGMAGYDIGVRIITPYFIQRGEEELKLRSMGERNVLVVLPADMTLLEELEYSLRISALIDKDTDHLSTTFENIKSLADHHLTYLKQLVQETIKKADIYVDGSKMFMDNKLPLAGIRDAFKLLIDRTYTKLTDLYTQDAHENPLNSAAVEEGLALITRQFKPNTHMTIGDLVSTFRKAPYGWHDRDVFYLVLNLLRKEDIYLQYIDEMIPLSEDRVVDYFEKGECLHQLLIKVKPSALSPTITQAQNLAKEIFNITDLPFDEQSLLMCFHELAHRECYDCHMGIDVLLSQYQRVPYPGKSVLVCGAEQYGELLKITTCDALIEYLEMNKEQLMDYIEDMMDIRKFFATQQSIFDDAIAILNLYEVNRPYILDADMVEIILTIEKIVKLPSPYSQIHQLPQLAKEFRIGFLDLLHRECEPIRASIEGDRAVVCLDMQLKGLTYTFSSKVNQQFDELLSDLNQVSNIYEAIAKRGEGDRLKQCLLNELIGEETRLRTMAEHSKSTKEKERIQQKIKTVQMETLFSDIDQLASQEEITQLTDAMKKKLMAHLEDKTIIKII